MPFYSRSEYLEILRQTKSTKLLLATITHDLSNRINVPYMNIDLLLSDLDSFDSDETKEILSEAQSAIEDILNMIEAIRDYNREK